MQVTSLLSQTDPAGPPTPGLARWRLAGFVLGAVVFNSAQLVRRGEEIDPVPTRAPARVSGGPPPQAPQPS